MPTPEGLNTTVLHMQYVEPDATGTPLQGTLTFSPTPSPILFPTENIIVAGTETATLDVNGEATIELISTDQAGENPTGWLYSVTEKIIGQKPRTFNIALPYNAGVTVELSDIIPTDVAPTYIPVVGPQGAPGVITTINGHSAATVNLTSADVGAIPTTAINAANGVVGISAAGRVGVGITGGALWADFMVQSAVDEILAAFVQTNATATNPGFLVQGPNAGWGAFGTSVGGDAQNRFNFTAGGTLTWGTGAAATDVSLARTAVGELTVGGQILSSQAAPTAAGHLTRKDYVDTLDGANVKLTGTQTVAGAKTFSGAGNFSTSLQTAQLGVGTAPGTNGGRFSVKSTVDETVIVVQNTVTATNPLISAMTFDTGTTAFSTRLTTDTVGRLAIKGSGNIEFGPGTGARDTTLSRSAANELTASGQLVITTAAPTAAGHATRKDYVDNNFSSLTGAQTISGVKTYTGAPIMQAAAAGTVVQKFQVTGDANPRLTIGADGTLSFGPGTTAADLVVTRSGSAALGVNNTVRVTMGATTSVGYSTIISGDTFDRYRIYMDGKNEWGPGNAARDTNLYRNGVGILQTDTAFVAGGTISASNFNSGAWTAYTPTWSTQTGSNTPSFGNATVDCKWNKFGRMVVVRFSITFGSTTNFGAAPTGSDNWQFSLPVAAAGTTDEGLGFMEMYQSGTANGIARVKLYSTTGIRLGVSAGSTANIGADVDSTQPFTWASGNTLRGTFIYESAS